MVEYISRIQHCDDGDDGVDDEGDDGCHNLLLPPRVATIWRSEELERNIADTYLILLTNKNQIIEEKQNNWTQAGETSKS